MKTFKLTGAALDWAVGMCEGDEPQNDFESWPYGDDWAMGGPIIEREKIALRPFDGGWEARIGGEFSSIDKNPLEAAMRCYVFSKLGDEVKIPKEVL